MTSRGPPPRRRLFTSVVHDARCRPSHPVRPRGGGALGAFQVGGLVALAEAGIVPDALFGCSAGALNAAFLASDPTRCARARQLAALVVRRAARAACWRRDAGRQLRGVAGAVAGACRRAARRATAARARLDARRRPRPVRARRAAHGHDDVPGLRPGAAPRPRPARRPPRRVLLAAGPLPAGAARRRARRTSTAVCSAACPLEAALAAAGPDDVVYVLDCALAPVTGRARTLRRAPARRRHAGLRARRPTRRGGCRRSRRAARALDVVLRAFTVARAAANRARPRASAPTTPGSVSLPHVADAWAAGTLRRLPVGPRDFRSHRRARPAGRASRRPGWPRRSASPAETAGSAARAERRHAPPAAGAAEPRQPVAQQPRRLLQRARRAGSRGWRTGPTGQPGAAQHPRRGLRDEGVTGRRWGAPGRPPRPAASAAPAPPPRSSRCTTAPPAHGVDGRRSPAAVRVPDGVARVRAAGAARRVASCSRPSSDQRAGAAQQRRRRRPAPRRTARAVEARPRRRRSARSSSVKTSGSCHERRPQLGGAHVPQPGARRSQRQQLGRRRALRRAAPARSSSTGSAQSDPLAAAGAVARARRCARHGGTAATGRAAERRGRAPAGSPRPSPTTGTAPPGPAPGAPSLLRGDEQQALHGVGEASAACSPHARPAVAQRPRAAR